MDLTGDISIEIKPPFPNPLQLPVHYKLTREYVMQVLCQMKSTGRQSNLYSCVHSNSITIIESVFDASLWKIVWSRITMEFDMAKPKFPSKISEIPYDLIPLLDDCICQGIDCIDSERYSYVPNCLMMS